MENSLSLKSLKQADNIDTGRLQILISAVIECKKAHGKKEMAWVGIVDRRILPVIWFQGSVSSNVCLEQVFKNTVWQSVKNLPTRRQYWFQQEGAS